MKKITLIFVLLLPSLLFAEKLPSSKAEGVFIAVGVGPRLPVGSFSTSTDLGYGFNLELSYTDSDFLPFFIFAKIGLEQYPGSQDFYQATDYSNFSTRSIPAQLGVRYFFSPLFNDIVPLIPVLELAASYSFIQKLHEFKIDSGRTNFKEDISAFGGSAGIGISMFLLEIMASYNYYKSNQYFAFNLNVRLPLLINF